MYIIQYPGRMDSRRFRPEELLLFIGCLGPTPGRPTERWFQGRSIHPQTLGRTTSEARRWKMEDGRLEIGDGRREVSDFWPLTSDS